MRKCDTPTTRGAGLSRGSRGGWTPQSTAPPEHTHLWPLRQPAALARPRRCAWCPCPRVDGSGCLPPGNTAPAHGISSRPGPTGSQLDHRRSGGALPPGERAGRHPLGRELVPLSLRDSRPPGERAGGPPGMGCGELTTATFILRGSRVGRQVRVPRGVHPYICPQVT